VACDGQVSDNPELFPSAAKDGFPDSRPTALIASVP
jgi:hypothetical protein